MSPFKSEAQRKKFYELAKEGKIKQSVVDEWEKATPKHKPLPDRLTKKKPAKKGNK